MTLHPNRVKKLIFIIKRLNMPDVIVINSLCHGYIVSLKVKVKSSKPLVIKLKVKVKVVPNLNRA